MSPSIKPSFITYRPSRFSKINQNSVKYGHACHQIDYAHQSQAIKRQEYLTHKLSKSRTRHILYVVLTTDFKLERFIIFCRKLRHVSSISLHLGEEITEDPKPSHLLKLFRKLFVQNKQIKNLTLDFVNEGNLSRIINRTLKFSKNIQNVKFSFELFPETLLKPILEDLSRQLLLIYHRKNWHNLASQSFSFHILQNIFNEILFSECLMNFYSQIQHKPLAIDLLFYFLFTNNPVVQGVAKTIENIPSLKSLSLGSWMTIDLSSILDAISTNKSLNSLDIYIPNQEIPEYKLLSRLPQVLQMIPSLRKLEISMDNIQQVDQINLFLQELRQIQHIENLHLIFSGKNNINNDTMAFLSDSLVHLKNLKSLTIGCNIQSLTTELTSSGLKYFFQTIAKLGDNIKELCLSFNGYKSMISDVLAKVLFQSIGKLKNLEQLVLNLESNNVGNKSITELTKSFKNLPKMDMIRMNLGSSEWLSGKVVTGLIQRITECKGLMDLYLHLKCKEIEKEGVVGALGKMAARLKNLNCLHMILCRDESVGEEELKMLEDMMNKLGNRLQVDFISTLSKE